METKYDHLEVEKNKYKEWVEKGYFDSGDKIKKPFTIVIPPPNVTGKLHLGHAWDTTLQDIIIRRKRMQGFDALWLPGMDHAGIATQAKVEQRLKELKIDKYEIGREKFLEYAWGWKEEYSKHIREQWASLGLSLDYKKERFTLDKGLNDAVNKVFIDLYNKGYIYRGERIINWDVQAQTAISNIEVIHKDTKGAFYYFIYPFTDFDGGIEVATTRPETMFGDQAIMVHPDDMRYKKFVGKTVYIPGTKTIIPIITDKYVDKNFKTGCVKVTPAHDINDFEVGKRHNLKMPICMNEDGTMNDIANKYKGQDRFECRKQLVNDLRKIGLCTKVENTIHQVGYSERTDVVIEPRLSKQWFVKMDELAKNAISKHSVEFIPERFVKTFNHWLEGVYDWCISRQLWWGHAIPAWHKNNEVMVQLESPGEDWERDKDVLDTWFSSALWPFSTLGWPQNTEDFKRYYPTDVLVTGYDIIFFWISRMVFQGIEFTKKSPFKQVLIHGLVRDEKGRKMSKSLGNGIDPMDIVEKYGCDTLRYFLSTNTAPGMDLRFETEKIESSWNYINKIWNIARYIKINTKDYDFKSVCFENLTNVSKWIIFKLNELIIDTDKNYEKYEFGLVSHAIYSFVKDDFAAKYIEFSKVDIANNEIETKNVLIYVLNTIMKLLHPFMPFVTEEIYQQFNDSSIVLSNWPSVIYHSDIAVKEEMDIIFDIITSVRNVRNDSNKAMSKKISYCIVVKNEKIKDSIINNDEYIKKFTNPNEMIIYVNQIPKAEQSVVIKPKYSLYFPLNKLVNIEVEIEKIKKEHLKIKEEIKRSNGMLNNQKFILKAPKEKVLEERKKLLHYKEKKELLEKKLIQLKKAH